jgi:glutaredoxin 3
MARIVLYTTPYCGYCRAAKHLLNKKSVAFTEIDVSEDMGLRQEMISRAFGRRTVPQIFINGPMSAAMTSLPSLSVRRSSMRSWPRPTRSRSRTLPGNDSALV